MIDKAFLFIAITFPGILFSQTADTLAVHYSHGVKAAYLKDNLTVIASDAYEGRETGKKGQKMTAAYIRSAFKQLQLKPGNDTSFIQNYPLVVRKSSNIDFVVNGNAYSYRKDFYTMPQPEFHDQVFAAEEVVFIGYGIKDSLMHYNDYKKAPSLEGKTVMIYPGEPKDKNGNFLKTGTKEESNWSTMSFAYEHKIQAAQKAGAKTILLISEADPATVSKGRGKGERMKVPDEKKGSESLVFYISKEMGDKIAGTNLAALLKKGEQKGKPQSLKRIKTSLKIDIHRDEVGYSGDNVIGIVEGSEMKDEYVFVTAHYDHLGIINGEVYNGADDDGSGTVSVMALASSFAKAKAEGHGPKRSIVFMTVSGEEKGLLGSAWYVDHPTIPLAKIVCDLNIDMIGRVDDLHQNAKEYVYVIGSDKLSSELHSINEGMNAKYTKMVLDYTYNDPNDPNRFYYRSDHYNFAKNNIPVIFYFNGTHADYHQETDEVQKIDFPLMELRARLVFLTAWELANRTNRIVVDSNKK
jgi:Zn-dependent M28 family amino/carboxypeptidase